MSERSSSRSQLVERPKASSLPRLRMSTGRQGSKLEAQDLHLERQRPGVAGGGVDAGAEALELRPQPRLELRLLALGDRADPQRPHQLVDRETLLAGHLGDPALDHAPVEVHLPEPVLPVAVALGEEEVLALVGLDVGNAPAVAAHPHLAHAAPEPRSSPSPSAAVAAPVGARGPRQQRPVAPYQPHPQTRQPAPPASCLPGYWLCSQSAASCSGLLQRTRPADLRDA